MSNQKTLEVEYDCVSIIDALPVNERQAHQISDRLRGLFDKIRIPCDRTDCNTKTEVISALHSLVDSARAGKKFCLHFVSHGNIAGLWVKATDESIQWREFGSLLAAANAAMGGRLIVNMSTCQGLHGIKIVDPAEAELPLFGLIGVSRILFPDEAISLNERFYSKLVAGEPIQAIVREMLQDSGGEVLDCITADGYKVLSQKS